MPKVILNRFREVSLLYLILFFSIVLLLLVAALVNQKFRETASNFKKIHQGNVIINDVTDIAGIMTAAGTSIHTFLIQRDVSTYPALPQYQKDITGKINEIQNFMIYFPDQQKYLDSLKTNIEMRFDIWNRLISVSKDSLPLIYNTMTIKNTLIMRDILNESYAIRNHTNVAIETYIDDAQSSIRITGFMALVVTFFCVSFIIYSLFKLNKEVKHGIVMQAELKKKVDELDRSNADLERFAYVASHDLHAPLRKLYAFSEILLEREKNLSPDGIDIIKRMHLFVTRMQRLIDDMLEFSLNLNKVETTAVDLHQLAKNTMSNLAVSIAESNARIEMGTLPDRVIGLESQLDQLFQNIISNSIKYAREGVPPHIRIHSSIVSGSDIDGVSPADEKRKFHKIIFSDNGIGFDNKYKEKIFIIFQRLHGKSEYEGTGIGLATCKKVMENHGGYITARGTENKGAEFSVYFPVE